MHDFNINIRTMREGVSVQKSEKKGQERMKKLIRYSETPQVTGLEYSEQRDLKEHPEKKKNYEDVVRQRLRMDARRK
jgi:hypothetical protein